jgi:senataxin
MRIPQFRFDVIIIDEAAQAVEPSALIPLKFNPQVTGLIDTTSTRDCHRLTDFLTPQVVVLIGDPQQLPALVFSPLAKAVNYQQSLFARLQKAHYPLLMLETQYRMHRSITV